MACRLVVVLWLCAALPAGAAASGSLRVQKVRGASVLIELSSVRVAINPRFGPPPMPGVVFDGVGAALGPDDLGRLDLVLVTDGWGLDARDLSRLDLDEASCLVPDEASAKRFRLAGARRVRVVRPGDVVETRGVRVEVSPTGAGPDRLGYHLRHRGRTVWHAGHPPPLDVDAAAGRFAKDHPAEVVIAPAAEALAVAGVVCGGADARLLAELATARYLFVHDEDARPTAPVAWLLEAVFDTPAPKPPARARARPVWADPGVWYRIARDQPPEKDGPASR